MTSELNAGDALSRPRLLAYIVTLGSLAALGALTVDLYLPALPSLAADFDTSTGAAQFTLAVTSIGFGVGQLVVGPWSDRIGRRVPLLVGASVHICASLAIAVAPTVEVVTVLRAVQGLGAAAGGVVCLAIVRDLFGGRPLVRILSYLALIAGLAPVVGPVIGAQLLRITDWRGLFVALAGYGILVMLMIAAVLSETLPSHVRATRRHVSSRRRFVRLLGDRQFLGTVIVGGMIFSALITYVASSPFVLQDGLGLDTGQFAAVFAINAVGLFMANQISSRIARRIGPQWVLTVSIPLLLVGGVMLGILAGRDLGLLSIAGPFLLIAVACGASFPCVQIMALAEHPEEAGTAASLLGVSNAVLGGMISLVPAALGVGSGASVGLVVGGVAAVALIVLWLVVRPGTVPALTG